MTRLRRLFGAFALVLLLVATFTPSSHQAWTMTAAYVATNNEEVKELPDNIIRAVNKFLSDYAPVVEEARE